MGNAQTFLSCSRYVHKVYFQLSSFGMAVPFLAVPALFSVWTWLAESIQVHWELFIRWEVWDSCDPRVISTGYVTQTVSAVKVGMPYPTEQHSRSCHTAFEQWHSHSGKRNTTQEDSDQIKSWHWGSVHTQLTLRLLSLSQNVLLDHTQVQFLQERSYTVVLFASGQESELKYKPFIPTSPVCSFSPSMPFHPKPYRQHSFKTECSWGQRPLPYQTPPFQSLFSSRAQVPAPSSWADGSGTPWQCNKQSTLDHLPSLHCTMQPTARAQHLQSTT